MSATVKCYNCGRIAHAKVIEDDPTTNSFECEPDWKDADQDGPTICLHEAYEVIDVDYSDTDDRS